MSVHSKGIQIKVRRAAAHLVAHSLNYKTQRETTKGFLVFRSIQPHAWGSQRRGISGGKYSGQEAL
jgi:hypothetical protein